MPGRLEDDYAIMTARAVRPSIWRRRPGCDSMVLAKRELLGGSLKMPMPAQEHKPVARFWRAPFRTHLSVAKRFVTQNAIAENRFRPLCGVSMVTRIFADIA